MRMYTNIKLCTYMHPYFISTISVYVVSPQFQSHPYIFYPQALARSLDPVLCVQDTHNQSQMSLRLVPLIGIRYCESMYVLCVLVCVCVRAVKAAVSSHHASSSPSLPSPFITPSKKSRRRSMPQISSDAWRSHLPQNYLYAPPSRLTCL